MSNLKITTKKTDRRHAEQVALARTIVNLKKTVSGGNTFREPQLVAEQARYVEAQQIEVQAMAPLNAAINAVLAKANGRATSFTLSDARDVITIARDAESRLDALPQKMRVGTIATWYSSAPSRSYKYKSIGAKLVMLRVADGWRLVSYSRINQYPTGTDKTLTLTISAAARDKLCDIALHGFTVKCE